MAIRLAYSQIKGHIEFCPNQLKGLRRVYIGKGTSIGKGVILTAWEQYGENHYSPTIKIGENCNIGQYNHISAINNITIGNNVLTGRYVYISDNSHGKSEVSEQNIPPIRRQLYSKGSVIIGHNVWIGENVCVLAGVRIGNGAIIGANAVVTHDVPPHSVAVGVPAKVVKTFT